MGAKLSREMFDIQISANKNENALAADMELLSYKKLDEDFDRLYLDSREQLQAITGNPSDELMKNISRCLNTNAKFLSNCFNEAASSQYEIIDLITERLTHQGNDHKATRTESKHAESYLPIPIKKQQLP